MRIFRLQAREDFAAALKVLLPGKFTRFYCHASSILSSAVSEERVMDWFKNLSIRWKFQLGFFVVTMVTTIYNRMLASTSCRK